MLKTAEGEVSSNVDADLGGCCILPPSAYFREKNKKKTDTKRSHDALKALKVSTCSCDSKTFEGKCLSLGQYAGEFVIKWDFWEGKPLVQILSTSPSGVLPYTVQVTPPLAPPQG